MDALEAIGRLEDGSVVIKSNVESLIKCGESIIAGFIQAWNSRQHGKPTIIIFANEDIDLSRFFHGQPSSAQDYRDGGGSIDLEEPEYLQRLIDRHENKYWREDGYNIRYNARMNTDPFEGLEEHDANRLSASVSNFLEAMMAANGGVEGSIETACLVLDGLSDKIFDQEDVERVLGNLDIRKSETTPKLPEKAKKLYVPRVSGKASDFLQENYGSYIQAGTCFRPDIKRLDPKLEMALANEFRGRTEELRAILPTITDRADVRLEEAYGRPVRPEKRKAALTALSIAKRVSHQKI